MAKSPSSKKPRQSRKSAASSVQPAAAVSGVVSKSFDSWKWLFRPRQLVIAAAVASLWILVPQVIRRLPDLEQRPEYLVGPEQVTLSPPPHWIPPDLVRQVFERAGFSDNESLLDDTLSERVAAAFYTHPWIENVRAVRKSFPARLQVDVIYREPVAMVRGIDGCYPVDRHGILLPSADFSSADITRYPIIEQVASVPEGRIGEKWGDRAVDGAAELAAVLNNTHSTDSGKQSWWEKLGLQAILVPRHIVMTNDVDEKLEFVLRTNGGSEIHWGRGPSTLHPGELTVEQKLGRLADYQRDFGGFDDSHGPYVIDIRPWNGINISRDMLAKEQRPGATVR